MNETKKMYIKYGAINQGVEVGIMRTDVLFGIFDQGHVSNILLSTGDALEIAEELIKSAKKLMYETDQECVLTEDDGILPEKA